MELILAAISQRFDYRNHRLTRNDHVVMWAPAVGILSKLRVHPSEQPTLCGPAARPLNVLPKAFPEAPQVESLEVLMLRALRKQRYRYQFARRHGLRPLNEVIEDALASFKKVSG